MVIPCNDCDLYQDASLLSKDLTREHNWRLPRDAGQVLKGIFYDTVDVLISCLISTSSISAVETSDITYSRYFEV